MNKAFWFLTSATVILLGLIMHFSSSLNQAETVSAQSQTVPTECIGRELARYMNTALTVAGDDLQKVKLTSPIFNLTNPAEKEIFGYMRQYSAAFDKIDAFAGNTYNLNGYTAMEYYESLEVGLLWPGEFTAANPSADVIFAEFGDFENGSTVAPVFNQAAASPKIIGINFFNAAGTNPAFEYHVIPPGTFSAITSVNPDKAGVNTAATPSNEKISQSHSQASGNINWILEIYTGPDVGSVINGANHAKSLGINNYIVRLCTATGPCGFRNPAILGNFIKQIDSQAPDGVTIWVVVGPNEPATETWATPTCKVQRPYDLKDVACNATIDPEYHSLRPYPASTCDPAPDGTWLCGNDLIVRQTLQVNRSDASGCVGNTCTFNRSGSATVYLDLNDADLPILGNTELVPNAVTSSDGLEDPVRVGEYVSWYLNGTIFRAEEPALNPGDYGSENRIVSFSGPLRRLLPRFIQTLARIGERGSIGSDRHNQIIECGENSPVPCYDNPNSPPKRVRLSDQGTENSVQFPYSPFSSTEDDLGSINLKLAQVNAPEVTNVTFTPTTNIVGQESQKRLYFAHTSEVDELSNLLQLTYKPQGIEARESRNAVVPPQQQPGCVLLDARDNSGDKLYGENTYDGSGRSILKVDGRADTPRLEGQVTYDTQFTCELEPPVLDWTCYAQCVSSSPEYDPNEAIPPGLISRCTNQCTPNPSCSVAIPISFNVNVQTPDKNESIWDKLVAANMSVFRRVFPKFGAETPIKEIKDLPGKTTVTYGADTSDGSISVEAGNPSAPKSASQAELYFPHLGGLQEYFLKGIQGALSPKGANTPEGPGGEPDPGSDVGPEHCTASFMEDAFGPEKAANAACIATKESAGCTALTNTGCLRIGGTQDYSIGIFQINLMYHPWRRDKVPPALKQRFIAAGLPNDTYCPDGFSSRGTARGGRMTNACVIGNQTIVDICTSYFLNPENSKQYAAQLQRDQGWDPWATAPLCVF